MAVTQVHVILWRALTRSWLVKAGFDYAFRFKQCTNERGDTLNECPLFRCCTVDSDLWLKTWMVSLPWSSEMSRREIPAIACIIIAKLDKSSSYIPYHRSVCNCVVLGRRIFNINKVVTVPFVEIRCAGWNNEQRCADKEEYHEL